MSWLCRGDATPGVSANEPQCCCCWLLQVLLSLDYDDDWADNPVVCCSWALSWDFKEAFDEAFDVSETIC